ncbi:MAG: YesL family protein [Clostridia bacterium]|nr:YesL family protein [Clostridia bacterium]
MLNKLTDLVILSCMWLVSCLPVITVGAACASAYDAVVKVIRKDSGYMFQTYWQAFGKNWRRSWLPALALEGISAILIAIAVRLWPIRDQFFGGVYFFMTCFFVLTVVIFATHLYSLIGRFTLSVRTLSLVALWMTFTRPLGNLLLAFVTLGLCWMASVFWPLIVALPGLYFWFLTNVEEPGFHRFLDYPDDLKKKDEM